MSHGTKIKICGLTQRQDIDDAIESGADAIGLVMYEKSSRYVSIDKASELLKEIPPFITTVAVLVNPKTEQVQDIIKALPIDVLQFHGDEDEAFCLRFNHRYIKAIRVNAPMKVSELEKQYPSACAFLLDSYDKSVYGGSGQTFAWQHIDGDGATKPIIVAGGLNKNNALEAIKSLSPYGLDVSSGVEDAPGIKNKDKIKAFINTVK